MKVPTHVPIDFEQNATSAVVRSRMVQVIETRSLLPIGWGNGAGKLICEYYTPSGRLIGRVEVEAEEVEG